MHSAKYRTNNPLLIGLAESPVKRYGVLALVYIVTMLLFISGTGWLNTIAGGLYAGMTMGFLTQGNKDNLRPPVLAKHLATGILILLGMLLLNYKIGRFPEFMPSIGQHITGLSMFVLGTVVFSIIGDFPRFLEEAEEFQIPQEQKNNNLDTQEESAKTLPTPFTVRGHPPLPQPLAAADAGRKGLPHGKDGNLSCH